MKKILLIIVFPLLVIIGCSVDNGPVDHAPDELPPRVISLTATAPGPGSGSSSTRVSLEQVGLDINLAWEANDEIHLVFVDGDDPSVKARTSVTLQEGDIENEGRSARFEIAVPEAITSEVFDLYGIHGNISFSTTPGEEHLAIFPDVTWSGGSLGDVQDNDFVIMAFESTNIGVSAPVAANFQHLGSLFNIRLRNRGPADLTGITGAQLYAASPFPVQGDLAGTTYNLVEGTFSGASATRAEVSFTIPSTTLASGESLDFWGWYPVVEGAGWPALDLMILSGSAPATTVSKDARPGGAAAGKAYYFLAEYYSEGDLLSFYGPAIDIDGNVYKTVVIGNQEWFAENLRVTRLNDGTPIPNVTEAADWAVLTTPGYCYFNNNPVNGEIYGALYNWYTVETDKLCPEGWHVPSPEEFTELTEHLGGLTGAAYKLKETGTEYWNSTSPLVTNETGFSARGAGYRDHEGGFYSLGHRTRIYTSMTERRDITANSGDVAIGFITSTQLRRQGYSIRCLKDN